MKLAGEKLDLVRRRVQQDALGHRGRKTDPLYRARKLLVMAQERLDERADTKLTGLLAAGDPEGGRDGLACQGGRDTSSPPEVRQLGRTMRRWRTQIAAWHAAQARNGPTETMIIGLAKRIKRVAFGITNFVHWRIRMLHYAGRPDWSLLPTVTPA